MTKSSKPVVGAALSLTGVYEFADLDPICTIDEPFKAEHKTESFETSIKPYVEKTVKQTGFNVNMAGKYSLEHAAAAIEFGGTARAASALHTVLYAGSLLEAGEQITDEQATRLLGRLGAFVYDTNYKGSIKFKHKLWVVALEKPGSDGEFDAYKLVGVTQPPDAKNTIFPVVEGIDKQKGLFAARTALYYHGGLGL